MHRTCSPTNLPLGSMINYQNCANDINEWLISNNLLLNSSDTKLSHTYFPHFLIGDI